MMSRMTNHILTPSFLLAFTFLLASCSKDEPNDEQRESFVKYYGNAYGNTVCNAVQLDGSYFLLGTVVDANGYQSMRVIKTDDFGNTKGSYSFGEDSASVEASKIIKTSDGCVAILGTFKKNENSRMCFLKLSANCDAVFRHVYDNVDVPVQAQGLVELSDGKYLLGGYCSQFVSGGSQLTLVVDSDGNPVRKPVTTGSANDNIGSLKTLDSGGILTIGVGSTVVGTRKNASPRLLVFIDQLSGKAASFSFSTIAGSLSDFVQISDDEIIACGTTDASQKKQGLVMSINPRTCLLNWYKTYGSTQTSFNGVAFAASGDVYLTGSSLTQAGDADLLVVKMDVDGNFLSEKTIGYTSDEVGMSIFESDDNKLVVCATYTYDSHSVMAIVKDDFDY